MYFKANRKFTNLCKTNTNFYVQIHTRAYGEGYSPNLTYTHGNEKALY